MLKTFIAVLCFLILPSCKNEKPITFKSDLIAEREDLGFLFGWLDTEQENTSSLFEEIRFEEVSSKTQKAENQKAEFTMNEIKVIGRAVAGVSKWKKKQGAWWECGKVYKEDNKIEDMAFLYVVQIFRSAKNISDESYKLNPWGILGVIANESCFDRCALGLNPRNKAYDLKIIEKRKECISHTEREVLTAVNHPKMRKYFYRTGFDLGVGQMLSRFYSEEQSYDRQIELVYGCDETARELRNRAFWKRSKNGPSREPWLFWRGSATPWYAAKIRRWARRFGAREDEI